MLLGFTREWPYERGRLRVLRSGDREDYAFEFAPEFGRMLMFRVCDHSWHGFLPQKGQRMSLQLCYVDSDWYVRKRILAPQRQRLRQVGAAAAQGDRLGAAPAAGSALMTYPPVPAVDAIADAFLPPRCAPPRRDEQPYRHWKLRRRVARSTCAPAS